MLADKSQRATVDELHQRFLLERNGRTTNVIVAAGSEGAALGDHILKRFDVTEAIELLDKVVAADGGSTFEARVDEYGRAYASDTKIVAPLTTACRGCPYRIDDEEKVKGLKSGFDECWTATTGMSAEELKQPLVVDMGWLKVSNLVNTGHFLLEQVEESVIKPREDDRPGLSFSQRRWLQIEKLRDKSVSSYFDTAGMADAFSRFRYPLHMIDFETIRAAVPFHRGSRPYALLAFQFSHHVVEADGTIRHATEFLSRTPGAFPSFEFVRALRAALNGDSGTIFRYAAHENTVLCDILRQIEDEDDPPEDCRELIAWIKTITHAPSESDEIWRGERDMVDMLDLVKRFYYHPATRGSNSIKHVLPAVLQDSEYLRQRYRRPIYGAEGGIKSFNFSNWSWLQTASDGSTIDPYKLLPPLFDKTEETAIKRLYSDEDIREGGAAMTAFARMQFTQMEGAERDEISNALLKYCELDTFAMVMLYEHWRRMLGCQVSSRND